MAVWLASAVMSGGAEEVPPVAGDVEEDRDPAIGLGPWFPDEGDTGPGHPSVSGVEVVDTEEEPDRPATWLPTAARWCSPSARASGIPVWAPGGRTTTYRLGRPSLVSDGESSTRSKPSTSLKNAIAES